MRPGFSFVLAAWFGFIALSISMLMNVMAFLFAIILSSIGFILSLIWLKRYVRVQTVLATAMNLVALVVTIVFALVQ